MESTTELSRDEVLRRYREVCREKNEPNFAPSDGYCWECKADMVAVQRSQFLHGSVTGCRSCGKSYCD